MVSSRYIKIFFVFILFISLTQGISAQEVQSPDGLQVNDQINSVNSDTQNQGQDNNKIIPLPDSQPDQESANFNNQDNQVILPNRNSVNKPQAETKLNFQNKIPQMLQKFDLAPKNETKEYPEKSVQNIQMPHLLVKILNKLHISFSTLAALLGLAGTFLGLFSTWLIYHLNRKNSDPLVIDRKDSAIKYLEVIQNLKDNIHTDKIRRLDNLLDIIITGSLSQSESNELINLVSFYRKSTIAISEMPVLEIHNRYKKHLKKKHVELFNAFIALYKLIEVDGKFYIDNDNLEYTGLDSINFFSEKNIRKWKHKIIALHSINDKASMVKNILYKELKR